MSGGAVKIETEGTDTGRGTAVTGGSTDLTPEITGVIGPVGLETIVITGRIGMTGQGMTDRDTEKIHVVKTRSKGQGLRSFCPGLPRQGMCMLHMYDLAMQAFWCCMSKFACVVLVAVSCQSPTWTDN